MKRFTTEEVPKFAILAHVMPKLKDYRLDDDSYSFDILPNRLKGNHRRAYLSIIKDTRYTAFVGSNLADKLYLLSCLDYVTLDEEYILNVIKTIYNAANHYKIFNPKKNKSHYKNILNRLKNKSKLDFTSKFKTHFDVVGLLGSKSKYKELVIQRKYLFTEDFKFTEFYFFKLPLPYSTDDVYLNIMISQLDGEWRIHGERIKLDSQDVDYVFSNLSEFQSFIQDEFSTHYSAVVKHHLDIDTKVLNEDYITLLRMISI